MNAITTSQALESVVRGAVANTTATDIHTHLFPPAHGGLLLWGVDEVLTYHYLVSELFTFAPRSLTIDQFWAMPKAAQADLVWKYVFLEHGAISESARGVVTTLNRLGLDVAGRDLAGIRRWFAAQTPDAYLEKVFALANIDYAVMTNDPFAADEVQHWNAGAPVSPRLKTALRIDTLLLNWPAAAKTMRAAGYRTAAKPDAKSYAQARKYLIDWAGKLGGPRYMAVSLPPDFAYPARGSATAAAIKNVALPVARELNLPLAMMIGVKRGVNPALRFGGDGLGVADVSAVQNICTANGDVKFLVTMLSRVNQHELCACARLFANLHLFGCWWFCNEPSIIEEMTLQRLEMMGTAFTANHSDARVMDQLIYKWHHTRLVLADVLARKYRLLWDAGWRPTAEEVNRCVRELLGGAYENFMRK